MPKFQVILVAVFSLISCNDTEYDWIDRSRHEGLVNLNASELFETYATESKPKHIINTIKNLEFSKTYLDEIFNEDLNFAVLFIDNENWNNYAFSPPPGMPQAHHKGNMVLGLGKSAMAKRAEKGIQNMPDSSIQELQKHFGNDIDLDIFFRDGLALHELGHLYQFYRIGNSSQRRWLDELFGNLCQVGAAKNMNNQSVFNQMDVYQNILVEANQWGELDYITLEQFETDYFEILKTAKNYGWYQTRFYNIAKELYNDHGDAIIVKFREFLISTNPSTCGKVDDEQLHNMLLIKFGEQVIDKLEW